MILTLVCSICMAAGYFYELSSNDFRIAAYNLPSQDTPLTPLLEVISGLRTLPDKAQVMLPPGTLRKLIGTRDQLNSLSALQHIVFSYRVSGNTQTTVKLKITFGGNIQAGRVKKAVKKFTRVEKGSSSISHIYASDTVEYSYSLLFTEYSLNKELSSSDFIWDPKEKKTNSSQASIGFPTPDMSAGITFSTPDLCNNSAFPYSGYTWVARGSFAMTIDEQSYNAAPSGTYALPIVITMEVI